VTAADDGALIDAAAREFFEAKEAGRPIDRTEFLQKYARIADELSEFFSGGEALDDMMSETHAWCAAPETPAPPVSIGDLDVGAEVGRGGMGVVYKAVQRGLGRTVAVKRIRFSNAASPADLERFRFEARAAAKLAHPNILPILTFVETDDEVLMVMPFIEGGDLRRRLDDGPLPPRLAAKIMIDVATGVAHAHSRGIVHRDLKPANIMLGDDGRAAVADFGLAKALDMESGLTQSGQIVGTPSFMAPEQAAGDIHAIGPAADVYSLGATLYALVVGRPPFQADSPFATIQLVLEHSPVKPRLLNPNVPFELQAIVMKCLNKSPADRYSSASELAADLQRFVDGERVRAEPPSLFRRFQIAFGRSRNREAIQDWGRPLARIGVTVFVLHLLLDVFGWFSDAWLLPRLATRAAIVLAMAWWFRYWRSGELGPLNPFERAIWAVWVGYLVAVPFADLGLAALDRTRGEAVAVESLLLATAFIATGGLTWGGCYAAGLAFLLLSIPAWFASTGMDVAFGSLFLASVVGLAVRGTRRE
jgi:predicted Ser/Thr protein kinase